MSALCKRLACIRPGLKGKTGIYERTQVEQIKWSSPTCRLCTSASNGKEVEHGFTRPDPEFAAKPQLRLSKWQKMLLFHSGKYPTMESCPDFAGEAELRWSTDICKTLFNIWCMLFLTFFFGFIHIFERRRMRREHARLNRSQARMMIKFDKINQDLDDQRKVQKLQDEIA